MEIYFENERREVNTLIGLLVNGFIDVKISRGIIVLLFYCFCVEKKSHHTYRSGR